MTGVTIMGMERGLYTGPMVATRETPVDGKTAGGLTEELAGIGAALMVEVLERLDHITPTAQPAESVTYAAKIEKEEARLDFSRSAVEVERQIRAFNPFPGAFFEYGGERIKLLADDGNGRAGVPGTPTAHGQESRQEERRGG